jgi:hypothetical protein
MSRHGYHRRNDNEPTENWVGQWRTLSRERTMLPTLGRLT